MSEHVFAFEVALSVAVVVTVVVVDAVGLSKPFDIVSIARVGEEKIETP